MQRTATVDVTGGDFDFVVDVTKTFTRPDGRRVIRGVASGVAEDRDGERVSANAIRKMAQTLTADGGIKLTSSHQQDWATEIGTVTKLEHDPATDELIYEAELPPDGVDPIADKAWRAMTVEGRKLSVSIGGKLRKAFYELAERGGRVVKRKVLDEIGLRHLALTETPSYRHAFAEAVAKTFTGDTPADTDFFHSDDDVAAVEKKSAPEPEDQEQPAGDSGPGPAADDADQPEPPAGTGDTSQEGDDDGSAAEDAKDLPEAKRHLSCPNCGHEFAAPLPTTVPGSPDTDSPDTDTKDEGEAHKSQEITMNKIDDTVAKLRALAETEETEVAKTEAAAPAETVEPAEVAKTEEAGDGELSDVEKMVAASHRHLSDQVETLAEKTNEALNAVAKAVTGLNERFAAVPQGRKSVARILPPAGEVEKTETETDDVAKVANDPDASALDVLKAQNAANGIR